MSDTPHRLATRLAALLQRLAEYQVDAYLVPSLDAHLNEYVPIYQRRRAAITGFTGSAGDALLCPSLPEIQRVNREGDVQGSAAPRAWRI